MGGPLADLVDVRSAPVSLTHLAVAETAALSAVEKVGVRVNAGINVFLNRAEVYVLDRAQVEMALRAAKIQLPSNVEIIQVDKLATPATDIYGGLGLAFGNQACTSGFGVVQDGTGTRGIATAGHCGEYNNNVATYNGVNLPFVKQANGLQYDVQWHTAPGLTVRNLIFDGVSQRPITATKGRDQQAIGDFVCKYGINTRYTCGYINDKYASTGSAYSNTFIRFHSNTNAQEVGGGDSGGPVFNGNTALGIVHGFIGNDGVYMGINYVYPGIGVFVLTN